MDCKLRCTTVVLATALFWSGAVHATDDIAKGAARELANEAKKDFDVGNFEEAGSKFQRAYEIAKVPTLAVWAARALAKRGHLVAASELYRQAALLAPNDLWVGHTQQQAQADAERELGELQPRIPKLRIRIEGAAPDDIELTVDGAKIATALFGIDLPMDAGRRHIVGKKGSDIVEQTVELAECDRNEAVLTFSSLSKPPPPLVVVAPSLPPPTPPGSPRRLWGWIGVSVGVAGLLTGAVTGIVVAANSGLRNDCPNGTCASSKSGGVSTYNFMRNVSTVGFIVGGVGAAAGVTLLLWTPKGEAEPRVAIWLGPSSAGVKGAF